jgi:hypothetical protein
MGAGPDDHLYGSCQRDIDCPHRATDISHSVSRGLHRHRLLVESFSLMRIIRTAIWVAERVTNARFELEEGDTSVLVTCHGIGHEASTDNEGVEGSG